MDARRFRMTAWLAAAAICTLPAAATAHGPPTGLTHAEEHAAAARAMRAAMRDWARLRPAERRVRRRRAAATAQRAAQLSVDAPADEVGRWNLPGDRVPMPGFALNTVQLPTGKVLFWGWSPINRATGRHDELGLAYLWDPAQPTATAVDVTPRLDLDGDGDLDEVPLFCSGQSLLPDGRVLAAGGTSAYPDPAAGKDFAGLDMAFLFDPWTEQWSVAGHMRRGRWYPSQVELADGRIAIIGGWDEGGLRADNRELEIYDWRDGSITHMPAGDAVPSVFSSFPYYPHLFTMPGGDVLIGGPDRVQSGLLDTGALGDAEPGSAWTPIRGALDGLGGLNQYYRGFASGVILPGFPTRAAIIGGYVGYPVVRAVRDADVIDTAAATPRWSSTSPLVPPLDVARSNGNVVILPDGTLVAVGGGAGFQSGTAGDPAGANNSYTGRDQALKRVELLRPGVDAAWRSGPAQEKWRTYHSTAVLLPDGRVLSAGDDYWDIGDLPDPWGETGTAVDEAELYSPPYLFDGNGPAPRPAVGSAPAAVRYGDDFGIAIAARDAARAVLVAPAATTHGADMNQRHVELAVTGRVDGKGINVRAPADGTLAPPGYYMLFVIDAAGTPSVARWVRLGADGPDAPELAPDVEQEPTTDASPTPTSSPTPTPTAAPPAPPAPPLPAHDTRAPRLRITWLRAPRTRGAVRLRLRADERARITIVLRIRGHRIVRAVALRGGRPRTVAIKLPRTVARRLRSGRRATATLRLLAQDAAGNRTAVRRSRRLS